MDRLNFMITVLLVYFSKFPLFESGKYDRGSGDKIDILEVLNKFDLTALLQSPKELLPTNFIS